MVKVGLGKIIIFKHMGVKQMNVTVKLYQEYWKVCHINRLQKLKKADVIVLNTCAIRENSRRKGNLEKLGYVKNLK